MSESSDAASATADAKSTNKSSSQETAKRAAPRTPPTKVLATTRIAYSRQFDTARAFVIASPEGNAVTLGEVSPHADLSVNTLSMITSFLVAANLLTRSEGSKFKPTAATIEFERQYHWNQDTAKHALAPALQNSWFGQAIINRLKMRGSMPTKEAIELLASESVATPEYEPQIKTTLDWLIDTGVVDEEGGVIKISRKQIRSITPTPPAEATNGGGGGTTEIKQHVEHVVQSSDDQAGTIKLNVAIQISVKELEAMTPDRIAAFFQGLAAVVAAKGGRE